MEAIPCIAYCVEKYDYDDAEIVIVPVLDYGYTKRIKKGDWLHEFNLKPNFLMNLLYHYSWQKQ